MIDRKISDAGIEFLKAWEGLKFLAYKCSSGVWTIGYGHTENVKEFDEIELEQAEIFLRKDIHSVEKAVNKFVIVPLSQSQFDALVSFTFNCGRRSLKTSTLLRRINGQESMAAIKDALRMWCKVTLPNGQKVTSKGLMSRRIQEGNLYEKGYYKNGE